MLYSLPLSLGKPSIIAIRSLAEDFPVFANRYVLGLKLFLLILSRHNEAEPEETDVG